MRWLHPWEMNYGWESRQEEEEAGIIHRFLRGLIRGLIVGVLVRLYPKYVLCTAAAISMLAITREIDIHWTCQQMFPVRIFPFFGIAGFLGIICGVGASRDIEKEQLVVGGYEVIR